MRGQPKRGLGDFIEGLTKMTGIDKVVNKVTSGCHGCAKRKEYLNKAFPFKKAKETEL